MYASASHARLYVILGKIFSCIPICVDDLKTDQKHGNKLDETIKGLYDAMVRVVYKKMRSSKCQLMVITNTVFCPNDQPVQSRLLLQTIKKMANFDSSLLSEWRKMQSVASMLCVDILGFPINKAAVQDCIDYMAQILANKCVGTRSAQNWGLALYYRLLIQSLVPSEDEDWNSIFRYMAREICRITVEYSADSGAVDKFASAFRQMQLRNNELDPDGVCFNLHNLRTLTQDEKSTIGVTDPSLEYYAFDIEQLIAVMARKLEMRKDDFNIKGLRLLFKGQLRAEGVKEGFVDFYSKTHLLLHIKEGMHNMNGQDGVPYSPPTEDVFQSMDASNKISVHCFIVPKIILQLGEEQTEDLVDFKSIMIGRAPRINFYQKVITGEWRGFEDLRSHPLYRAADENGLWSADNWDDPAYRELQFNLIENVANHYRPEGRIVWPRASGDDDDAEIDIENSFYQGHERVFVDARANLRDFEQAQDEAAARRAAELEKEDDYEEGDEDETGHDQYEADDFMELDLPDETDADPWKTWVTAEHGSSTNSHQCPACKMVFSTELTRLLCNQCYKTSRPEFEAALQEADEDLEHERGKRQKINHTLEVDSNADSEDTPIDQLPVGIGEEELGSEDDHSYDDAEEADEDEDESMDGFVENDSGDDLAVGEEADGHDFDSQPDHHSNEEAVEDFEDEEEGEEQ